MINFKQITMENFWQVISLDVNDHQKNWVASNVVSIAESKVDTDEMFPLAVYNDDTLVGFIMYEFREMNGYEILFIDRLMIDKKHQGNGYGKAAMRGIIEETKHIKKYDKVVLSVHDYAVDTIEFYKKLGFNFNGEMLDDEHIMELRC